MEKKSWLMTFERYAAVYCAAYLPIFLWLSYRRPLEGSQLPYLRYLVLPLTVTSCVWWLCLAYFAVGIFFRPSLRDRAVARLAALQERDEREEIIVGRAARAMFLINVAALLIAGLCTMVGFRSYFWDDNRQPWSQRHAVMWPVLVIPGLQPNYPKFEEQKTAEGGQVHVQRFAMEYKRVGNRFFIFGGGPLFDPEVPAYFFAAAALEVLAFQLFARRFKA